MSEPLVPRKVTNNDHVNEPALYGSPDIQAREESEYSLVEEEDTPPPV